MGLLKDILKAYRFHSKISSLSKEIEDLERTRDSIRDENQINFENTEICYQTQMQMSRQALRDLEDKYISIRNAVESLEERKALLVMESISGEKDK